MTIAEALEMPRNDAPTVLVSMACSDCGVIYRSGDACPFCASQAVYNLATVLNRGEEPPNAA